MTTEPDAEIAVIDAMCKAAMGLPNANSHTRARVLQYVTGWWAARCQAEETQPGQSQSERLRDDALRKLAEASRGFAASDASELDRLATMGLRR